MSVEILCLFVFCWHLRDAVDEDLEKQGLAQRHTRSGETRLSTEAHWIFSPLWADLSAKPVKTLMAFFSSHSYRKSRALKLAIWLSLSTIFRYGRSHMAVRRRGSDLKMHDWVLRACCGGGFIESDLHCRKRYTFDQSFLCLGIKHMTSLLAVNCWFICGSLISWNLLLSLSFFGPRLD